jgi:hypothetical protein
MDGRGGMSSDRTGGVIPVGLRIPRPSSAPVVLETRSAGRRGSSAGSRARGRTSRDPRVARAKAWSEDGCLDWVGGLLGYRRAVIGVPYAPTTGDRRRPAPVATAPPSSESSFPSAWSTSTLRPTRSVIECHLKPLLGHLAVSKLTTVDIDDVYRHLLHFGGASGRPLALDTVPRVHVVLHRALIQAVRWKWVWLNPAGAASPPRVPPSEVRPPSPDQVQRVLTHVEESDPGFLTATSEWNLSDFGVRCPQVRPCTPCASPCRHVGFGLRLGACVP